MKILDTLLGRTKPKPANLDALFALPNAAITLETSVGLHACGAAAVCFKPATAQTFDDMRAELDDLLQLSAGESATGVRETDDTFGYHWISLTDRQLEDLVTTVHLVNSSLEDRGFGPQLLCSLFGFGPGDQAADRSPTLYLVYLYKRGTFYPFAPLSGQRRDNELELRIRGALTNELPIEDDLSRWFPLWDIPLA